MDNIINQVTLSGRVSAAPALSHVTHRENFYLFVLEIRRLSGVDDYIKIICPETLLRDLQLGDDVTIHGALRTYNNKSGIGSRLVITVLAQEITLGSDEPINHVVLCGTLCKMPVYRKTPLGREICDMLLAVNRRYGRADYLPCIVWGPQAREFSGAIVGTRLHIEGRIQSRVYNKVEDGIAVEKTAYEVSVAKVRTADDDAVSDDDMLHD